MAPENEIRVGAVDDHPVTRRGLELILADFPGIRLVAAAESPEALKDAPAAGPDLGGLDVIILDLYLGTGSRCDDVPALDALKELAARVPVLVMSASRHQSDVLDAIRAGASGYVTKDVDAPQLAGAITAVAYGGFHLSAQLADMVDAALDGRSAEPELSPREKQTLDLIARGFTHAQAARRMGVTKATVDTYVERIRRKLQVGNKAELTRAAMRRRYL